MDKLAVEASPHSGVDFIKFHEILRNPESVEGINTSGDPL